MNRRGLLAAVLAAGAAPAFLKLGVAMPVRRVWSPIDEIVKLADMLDALGCPGTAHFIRADEWMPIETGGGMRRRVWIDIDAAVRQFPGPIRTNLRIPTDRVD